MGDISQEKRSERTVVKANWDSKHAPGSKSPGSTHYCTAGLPLLRIQGSPQSGHTAAACGANCELHRNCPCSLIVARGARRELNRRVLIGRSSACASVTSSRIFCCKECILDRYRLIAPVHTSSGLKGRLSKSTRVKCIMINFQSIRWKSETEAGSGGVV